MCRSELCQLSDRHGLSNAHEQQVTFADARLTSHHPKVFMPKTYFYSFLPTIQFLPSSSRVNALENVWYQFVSHVKTPFSIACIPSLTPQYVQHNSSAPSGLGGLAFQKGYLFLAVEQNVLYRKPVPPLARYTVELSCSVRDDKWIIYKHRFLKYNGGDVSNSSSGTSDGTGDSDGEVGEVEYAVVDLRAVMKERSGKTVHPSQMKEASEWSRQLFDNESHDVTI